MTTSTNLRELSFGEIFTTSFSMMGRSLGIVVIGFILMTAGGYIFSTAMMHLMQIVLDAAMKGLFDPNLSKEMAGELGRPILGAAIPVLLMGVVLCALVIYAQVAATLASWEVANDRPVEIGDILTRSIGRAYWVTVLQTIILAVFMIIIFLVISAIFGALITRQGGSGALIMQLMTFIVIAVITTLTSVRVQRVAIESRGPWQGMIASIALTSRNFWRALGVTIIPYLASQAVSYAFGFAGNNSVSMGQPGTSQNSAVMIEALTKFMQFTPVMFIAIWALFSALFLVTFYLSTGLYIDLRARSGDFLPREDEDDLLGTSLP